jgi:hypothetical protein
VFSVIIGIATILSLGFAFMLIGREVNSTEADGVGAILYLSIFFGALIAFVL